ncbi:microviridin/marinostatin family tricyclic proteinase inhibitor [Calothrix sp. FACHB-1219]|uniref:microviridin/marinostatin family tricyclic proteinase inhibitor n=1 Tax=unclassified Calothrix TaxID=2619626 RepID=UPI0016852F6B|nr:MULTISPECIES: microviridin/marinostatin family tricyclic proteinase inhibitor [unclassified Calothrix]MBD2201143.1 microviridin/marinostatin family tricyclic proteinase inhibitor [Calothrix sp. FACHB-168]MBD2215577.1 microviridin/marinostatin family tricyclic proteinase inhibitor [Calothrix sp. FACHB-1219]
MSDIKLHDLDSPAVPFFARYLEGQYSEELSEEELSGVGGGIRFATKKYPSDHENGGGITKPRKDDIAVTLKYPSDNEEGGGGIVTKKAPSDTDELVTTLKYPSDGDDNIVTIDKIS